MRGFLLGDFDHDPERERRDTELTLGSGTLLAIFFGLVLWAFGLVTGFVLRGFWRG